MCRAWINRILTTATLGDRTSYLCVTDEEMKAQGFAKVTCLTRDTHSRGYSQDGFALKLTIVSVEENEIRPSHVSAGHL